MKFKRTLFFLGAGSSVSYGLPCGEQLIREICDDLKKESPLKIYLRYEIKISEDELKKFAQLFVEAVSSSIDQFLTYREDLKDIGRCVIGAKLISYENIEVLNSKTDDWFRLFLRHILHDCEYYNDASDVLSLFNFYTLNYDRTIEQILFQIFRSRYWKPDSDYPNIEYLLSSACRVNHAHGMLGSLSLEITGKSRPYNNTFPKVETFKYICKCLGFWDDGSNKYYDNRYLNTYIENAERVIFLGFGFHPGILTRFQDNILVGKEIFCTTKGVDEKKWLEIIRFLNPKAAGGNPQFGDKKVDNIYFEESCEDLIKRFIEEDSDPV